MPPLRFNEDLSKAQSIAIPAVSGLARGDDHDALKFTYHHQSLAEPIIVHMIAHDCMNYPQNVGFIAFLDLDNAGNDLTKCLDAVCQKKKWSSIQEAVQVIAQAMTAALDKRHNPSSDDSEDSSWDGGSEFEELDPVEISSTDEDRYRPSRHYPEALLPLKPESLASLRSSLQKAQLAGMTVGIYPRLGSSLPKFISLSAPATCLGVAAGILESWGLKQTDNLVLLIKIDSLYPDLADFLQLSSRQTVLQFRFGRCVGEKPSQASVQSAYRDTMHASQDDDSKDTVDDNAQFPFELINMSDSIAKLLNTDFMRLLATRRAHRLSWPNAQHVVSRLELQSNLPESIAQETDVENSNIQADPIHWQSLTGPISQDCAFDDAEAFSLPLVAMQLALHRLANCTRYCMIGHWPKSELQIVSAIAVCELINSPSEFVNTSPHYVVDKLDWIQCRYLLVSINPSAEAIQSQIYEPQSNVTPAYVVQDEAHQIKHNLESVEIPITAIPFHRRAFQTKTPLQTPTATGKVSLVEATTPLKSNYEADDVELYLGVDEDRDGLYFSKTKRRGTSTSSKSSRQSQYSNKRAKSICESSAEVFQAKKAQNICDFDPNGLDLESLRSLVPPDWASTSKQAIRRLTIDLKDLHRRQTTMGDLSSGYYVHTDKSDNMFQWIVEMFNFDAALPLARDMQELGCTSIVLEFRFGPSYPMSPPFVRVIRPQFVPFHQGGGGHVTIGGAVCLELLTNSGWNPAINIDNVIMQIRAAISEPDPPARIDKKFAGHDYGVGEAVAAFTRLAQTHGWAVPEDFQHIAAL
ncbi:hypothetical protein V2A60_005744 [Cordyceps javanica]